MNEAWNVVDDIGVEIHTQLTYEQARNRAADLTAANGVRFRAVRSLVRLPCPYGRPCFVGQLCSACTDS